MKQWLAFIATPLCLVAQSATSGVQVSGTCNTVATGNSNHITVTCSGLSKEKADDMVKLINSILRRQLDPNKVYRQLDEIYGAVAEINETIASSSNPLGGAPPEVMDRITRLKQLQSECQTFVFEWNRASSMGPMVARGGLHENMVASLGGAAPAIEQSPEKDRQYAAQYASDLAPRLNAWRTKVASQNRVLRSAQNWSTATSLDQLRFIYRSFGQLKRQYRVSSGADFAVVNESEDLDKAFVSLLTQWAFGPSAPAAPGASSLPTQSDNTTVTTNAVNRQRSAAYSQTLRPRLVTARDELSKFIPAMTKRDYDTVSDSKQMSGVCENFAGLISSYEDKAARDLRKSRVQSRTKK